MKDETSHFKGIARSRHQEVYASKTNPPAVGTYTYNYEAIMTASPQIHIAGAHDNKAKAIDLKC